LSLSSPSKKSKMTYPNHKREHIQNAKKGKRSRINEEYVKEIDPTKIKVEYAQLEKSDGIEQLAVDLHYKRKKFGGYLPRT
jgi:hypothetical protein